MKHIASHLCLWLVLATTVTGQYVDTRRLITVQGSAETELAPDRAVVSIGVEIDGLNIATVKKENDQRVRALIEAVKAIGIPAKDIQTSRLSIQPVYNYNSGRQELVTYRMRNVVTISVKDLSKVENVVNAGLAGGSNLLDGLQFASSRTDVVRDSLRIEATKDAKQRAANMAAAAGASLGKVVSISEIGSRSGYDFAEYARAPGGLMKSADDAGTPVSSGELTIRVLVNTVFEME